MRILIVEDEKKVAEFIKDGLKMSNFKIDLAWEGNKGLEMALVNNYNVILLDYMLPGLTGLEVLKALKKEKCASKVIMLTAKDDVEDKVACLNAGADDYMVKPFAFDELVARIRVVMRRNEQDLPSVLTFEGIEMNLLNMEVQREGRKLDLTSQELSLLEYFLRHPNQLVSRTQLLEHVWGDNEYGYTNKIEVYIFYLRQKIDKGFSTSLLHTIRGKGYILKI
jgi:DNA-binding response OmpR family regulator